MLFKSIFKILLVVASAAILQSCATSNNYEVRQPLLYKATRDKKVVYIFGTIHFGVQADDLSPQIWPIFNKVQGVVAESLKEKDGIDRDLMEYQNKVLLKHDGDRSLGVELTAEEYNRLVTVLKACKYDRYLNTYNARGVYGLLMSCYARDADSGIYEINKRYYEQITRPSKKILDVEFVEKARAQNKTVYALDSADNVFEDCLSVSAIDYVKKIKGVLDNGTEKLAQVYESNNNANLELLDAYRKSDVKKLNQLIGESIATGADSSDASTCILKSRNEKWIPRLETMLQDTSVVFVAVGVGHVIYGPDSLINILKKNKFTVSKIKWSAD